MSDEHKDMSVPGLDVLFKQLLGERARAAGTGFLSQRLPEVVPYDAVPPLAVDASVAWADALEAGNAFGLTTGSLECPSGWADLLLDAPPSASVPMCLGNFPQMVRDVKALADIENLPRLRPQPLAAPLEASGVCGWHSGDTSGVAKLLRAGLLRLAGDYAQAEETLAAMPEGRGKLRSALLNERAALRWHQADPEAAAYLWNEAQDEIPVLFNRGMAFLFSGQAARARHLLQQALKGLPAISGWRQLAELYLAVVELKA